MVEYLYLLYGTELALFLCATVLEGEMIWDFWGFFLSLAQVTGNPFILILGFLTCACLSLVWWWWGKGGVAVVVEQYMGGKKEGVWDY